LTVEGTGIPWPEMQYRSNWRTARKPI